MSFDSRSLPRAAKNVLLTEGNDGGNQGINLNILPLRCLLTILVKIKSSLLDIRVCGSEKRSELEI